MTLERGTLSGEWSKIIKGDAVPEVCSWLTLSGYGLGVGDGVGTHEHGQSDQEKNQ